MNVATLTKLLRKLDRDHKKRIFTLRELAVLCNESKTSVGMALIRAKKEGIADHVRNIWINMIDKPSLEELALEVVSPSYVSLESALYKHGILSQSPRGGLTLVTTSKPAKIKTPLGEIQFFHIQPKLLFGFDSKRVATPEKAFLDLVYLRMRRGTFQITETFYLDLLNERRLQSFANKFPLYVKNMLKEKGRATLKTSSNSF